VTTFVDGADVTVRRQQPGDGRFHQHNRLGADGASRIWCRCSDAMPCSIKPPGEINGPNGDTPTFLAEGAPTPSALKAWRARRTAFTR